MGFEILQPGQFTINAGLEAGECSIDRKGCATFRADDLAEVGIADRVVVMVDPETLRVGLRAPRDGEADLSARVMVASKKGAGAVRRRISLRRAIDRINLTPEVLKGRHPLIAKGKDANGMLILAFASLAENESSGPHVADQHAARPRFS